MNDNHAITKRLGQHAGPVTLAIRAVRQLMPWESDGTVEGERRAATWEARRTIMDVKDRSELEHLAGAAMHGPRELARALAAWNRRHSLNTFSTFSSAMDEIFGDGARETDPYPIAFTFVFQGLAAGNFAQH